MNVFNQFTFHAPSGGLEVDITLRYVDGASEDVVKKSAAEAADGLREFAQAIEGAIDDLENLEKGES